MAGKLAYLEANIIDPRWILNEDTGKLSYAAIRMVHSHPTQALIVSSVTKACDSTEITDRYLRIMEDKRRRRDG